MYEAFIKGDVMGILDDLAMGFGLKERTADYDARTARTIAANHAAQFVPGDNQAMALAQASNPDNKYYYGNNAGAMQAHDNYLTGQGYSQGMFPQPVDSGYSGIQNILFSAPMNPNSPSLSFNPPSPTPAAIGPFQLDEPMDLPIPGISMITKLLEGMRPKPLGDNQFIPYNPNALDVSMDPLMAQGLEEYFDMYTPAGTKKNPNY